MFLFKSLFLIAHSYVTSSAIIFTDNLRSDRTIPGLLPLLLRWRHYICFHKTLKNYASILREYNTRWNLPLRKILFPWRKLKERISLFFCFVFLMGHLAFHRNLIWHLRKSSRRLKKKLDTFSGMRHRVNKVFYLDVMKCLLEKNCQKWLELWKTYFNFFS